MKRRKLDIDPCRSAAAMGGEGGREGGHREGENGGGGNGEGGRGGGGDRGGGCGRGGRGERANGRTAEEERRETNVRKGQVRRSGVAASPASAAVTPATPVSTAATVSAATASEAAAAPTAAAVPAAAAAPASAARTSSSAAAIASAAAAARGIRFVPNQAHSLNGPIRRPRALAHSSSAPPNLSHAPSHSHTSTFSQSSLPTHSPCRPPCRTTRSNPATPIQSSPTSRSPVKFGMARRRSNRLLEKKDTFADSALWHPLEDTTPSNSEVRIQPDPNLSAPTHSSSSSPYTHPNPPLADADCDPCAPWHPLQAATSLPSSFAGLQAEYRVRLADAPIQVPAPVPSFHTALQPASGPSELTFESTQKSTQVPASVASFHSTLQPASGPSEYSDPLAGVPPLPASYGNSRTRVESQFELPSALLGVAAAPVECPFEAPQKYSSIAECPKPVFASARRLGSPVESPAALLPAASQLETQGPYVMLRTDAEEPLFEPPQSTARQQGAQETFRGTPGEPCRVPLQGSRDTSLELPLNIQPSLGSQSLSQPSPRDAEGRESGGAGCFRRMLQRAFNAVGWGGSSRGERERQRSAERGRGGVGGVQSGWESDVHKGEVRLRLMGEGEREGEGGERVREGEGDEDEGKAGRFGLRHWWEEEEGEMGSWNLTRKEKGGRSDAWPKREAGMRRQQPQEQQRWQRRERHQDQWPWQWRQQEQEEQQQCHQQQQQQQQPLSPPLLSLPSPLPPYTMHPSQTHLFSDTAAFAVPFPSSGFGVLVVHQGDITKWSVNGASDAIVNAAHKSLLGGGGVDGAIHRAAGPQLLKLCRDLPVRRYGVRCETGNAVTTGPANLPTRYVIHAVGPVYWSERESAPLLKSAYRSILREANRSHVKSIAIPAISCGIFGYPPRRGAKAALEVLLNQSWGSVKEVHFVLFDRLMLNVWLTAIYAAKLPELAVERPAQPPPPQPPPPQQDLLGFGNPHAIHDSRLLQMAVERPPVPQPQVQPRQQQHAPQPPQQEPQVVEISQNAIHDSRLLQMAVERPPVPQPQQQQTPQPPLQAPLQDQQQPPQQAPQQSVDPQDAIHNSKLPQTAEMERWPAQHPLQQQQLTGQEPQQQCSVMSRNASPVTELPEVSEVAAVQTQQQTPQQQLQQQSLQRMRQQAQQKAQQKAQQQIQQQSYLQQQQALQQLKQQAKQQHQQQHDHHREQHQYRYQQQQQAWQWQQQQQPEK